MLMDYLHTLKNLEYLKLEGIPIGIIESNSWLHKESSKNKVCMSERIVQKLLDLQQAQYCDLCGSWVHNTC